MAVLKTQVPSSISPWRERTFLLAAFLLLAIISLSSYRAWSNAAENTRRLSVAREMVRNSSLLLVALVDAETGQRGYLLTNRDYYLDVYREALGRIPETLGALQRLARLSGSKEAQQQVDTVRPIVAEKLAELQETIDVHRTQGAAASTQLILSDRGKRIMDRIRHVEGELTDIVSDLQMTAADEAEYSRNRQGLIATVGSALLFGLLLLAAVEIHHATARRLKLIADLAAQEEQTRQARDWLQTTLESIGDAVIATDEQGRVTLLNPTAQHLIGQTQADAAGRPVDELFVIRDDQTGAAVESPVGKALRKGEVVSLEKDTNLTTPAGTTIAIDDTAAPIRDAEGRTVGAVLVFRDITEKRRAEAKEREAALMAARLAAIVESSQDAIVAKDLNGIVTSWNRGAEALFGYTAEEMVGRRIQILNPLSSPDEMNQILERLRRGDRIERLETIRRTKSGRMVPIELTLSPIRDSHGVIIGASKIARDISARVASEKALAKQASTLARVNSELQQFSYAASHDLREPLRTVAIYSQLLERSAGDRLTEKERDYTMRVITGAHRMGQMVTALLEYSKSGEFEDAPVKEINTAEVLASVVMSLSGAIEEGKAQVTAGPLPVIWGHELSFSRVLQNLIGNAVKYRGKDAPRIHLSATEITEGGGGYWRFTVADNGQGIDPLYQTQIFRLFTRLHGQEYPGVGIGLAACKRIVERGGGRIWVESELGNGAAFHFTLPSERPPEQPLTPKI